MATYLSTKLFSFACILSLAGPSLCMEFKEQPSISKKKSKHLSKKTSSLNKQQEQLIEEPQVRELTLEEEKQIETPPTQQEQLIEEPQIRELTPEEEKQIETDEKEKTQEPIDAPMHDNSNWALVIHHQNDELLISTTSIPSHFLNTSEETAQLTERKITPAVTTAQGMGAGWTAYTIAASLTNSLTSLAIPQLKKGAIILDDLTNDRTTNDNSSCHHLLSDALREFSSDGNIPSLVLLINNWFKKHYEMIVPEPCHAQQAHHALTTSNKAELKALKDGHTALNKKAFEDINKATSLILEQLQTYRLKLTKINEEYQKNGLDLSSNHGNKYRLHKKTLCHLHQLAGIMELNTHDYCSDYEDEIAADGHKIIKNSKRTKQTYTDRHLLKKIDMHKHNENTQKQITLIIGMANALGNKANKLPELK
jgi:hypothetical protein